MDELYLFFYKASTDGNQYGGFFYAKDFIDATTKLVEYYDKDLISIDALKAYDSALMALPASLADKVLAEVEENI